MFKRHRRLMAQLREDYFKSRLIDGYANVGAINGGNIPVAIPVVNPKEVFCGFLVSTIGTGVLFAAEITAFTFFGALLLTPVSNDMPLTYASSATVGAASGAVLGVAVGAALACYAYYTKNDRPEIEDPNALQESVQRAIELVAVVAAVALGATILSQPVLWAMAAAAVGDVLFLSTMYGCKGLYHCVTGHCLD